MHAFVGSGFEIAKALLLINGFQPLVSFAYRRLGELLSVAQFFDDLHVAVLALETSEGLVNGLAIFDIND